MTNSIRNIFLILISLCSGCLQVSLAQTQSVTPQFRAPNTLTGHLDPLIYNYTGKIGGPDSLVNLWYLRSVFLKKTDTLSLSNRINSNSLLPNGLVRNIPTTRSSFFILSDSFGDSQGASTYQNGFAFIVPRSLLNQADRGYPLDRGFGYHSIINWADLLASNTGVSTTGTTTIATGITNKRLLLIAGQKITITNVAINFADVIYNASNSSGTLQINLNGALVRSRTLSGTGYQTTFDGQQIIPSISGVTKLTDTITITASANAEILALQLYKVSNNAPFVYTSAHSGTGFQDYTSSAAMDEIAYYLNSIVDSVSGTHYKYMGIALGTNDIYNSAKALTPANYILTLDTLINGIKSRVSNVRFIITVPSRSNESVWPVIMTSYTYQNYVDALVSYANTNAHVLVRYDKTQMGTGNATYLSDGLHPNDAGHVILASAWANVMDIRINNSLPIEGIPNGAISNAMLANSAVGNLSGTNTGDNAPNSSTAYIGTTAIALNRASAAQALTGITSIDGSAVKWTNARTLGGNSVDGSANVSFANKFIVQGTTDGGLSGAQFLGALSTGIVKNTTSTGILSIAVAGTDYELPLTFGNGLNRSSNTITNTGVLSIAGTTNQIIASASTGNVTLSLPQSICTTCTVSFGGIISTSSSGNAASISGVGGATITGSGAANTILELNATNTAFTNDFMYIHTASTASSAYKVIDYRANGVVTTTLDGAGNFNTASTITGGNIYSTSATPTIAVGAAAGSGATASIVGNNQDGVITLNGVATSTTGVVFTVTMSGIFAYPTKCTPILTQESTGAQFDGETQRMTTSGTSTTWTMTLAGGGGMSTGTFKINYHNGGY